MWGSMEFVYRTTSWNQSSLLKEVGSIPLPTNFAVANAISPFHHFRSDMCSLSCFVPAESSDQDADKSGFVCLDGPGCDV